MSSIDQITSPQESLKPAPDARPTQPSDWIRAGKWDAVRGEAWTLVVGGEPWDAVRGTEIKPINVFLGASGQGPVAGAGRARNGRSVLAGVFLRPADAPCYRCRSNWYSAGPSPARGNTLLR